MRVFGCECGATVFFDNSCCLSCGRELGFVPEARELVAFVADGSDGSAVLETAHGSYRKCANYAREGVCNWLVRADVEEPFCRACRLNEVIPDLSLPENRVRWSETEGAKRRLVYGLDVLGLPLISKAEDPVRGVSFGILVSTSGARVITGHEDGHITLDVSEADAAIREKVRAELAERYRTLLGHFRHEIGHYFWDRLVDDAGRHDEFRAVFGDERADYAAALAAHYAKAPDDDHAARFISRYAASHSWEDFAESFAHYLHLSDTLETAERFGFSRSADVNAPFEDRMGAWYRLTIALNALNRSMGLADAYPFAISDVVKSKLAYVDSLVRRAVENPEPPAATGALIAAG